ncbi:uncharacterized protein LOC128166542 isoform X2 [Crassostrea angulata]|uniref:uncharacterized protein LOC128166542 isoform X2 n=1 Tax=Magallana angulata TaxID=2784310 RepID=UPI0022B17372|nr:uncharacterized protein LOC128166542 isoform X2 [Crassostrea angulata]
MLNMGVPLSLSLSLMWLLLSFANCSHFRGGSISWKPTSNPSQIEISHQMAWRRSYSSSSYCDDTKIANGGLIALSANLYCREGCNSTSSISTMRGKCIAFSAGEDWSLGEGSFLFTVPTPGIQYTFRLEGCCWQSLSNGASSGSMRMTLTADLQPRSDTGVINSSPVVTMTPVVRLLAGCQHSLRIPVIDADGDIVRCRFPTSNSTNECGKLCDGLAGSTIDTDTCVFNYNSTSGTGTYGVSVQIEDFAVTAPTAVLSSVPVQFLIIVFYDSLSCDDAPSFVDPTPPEASCHVVTSTFTKTIVARTKNAAHSVTKIFLMGPTGITKTSLAPYGSSGREWSISVTWSPTSNQAGYHLVCFNAEINSKLSSSMICIDLMKGTPPSIKQNCLTPSSDVIMGPNITFKMCFDRKIMRPTTDKFMIIYHSNGTEANRFNITDPNIAIFSTAVDRTVTVTWGGSSGSDILGVGQYYILLEAGSVAAPPLSCLADWPGITQPFYWNFTVVDSTPPTLSFTSNPTQVNDNETFSMTWTVSEPLSVERCNLTTPSSSSIVNCRGSFTQNNLVAGNYSISIEIEDLNGNKAGPFDHQWVVTDVTPPSLTFVTNPSLTKSNASITWTLSEPVASSKCTVTFPNGTVVNETCNDQWEAIDLPRGTYQISIVLVDAAGNIGGAFRHTWTNIDVTPPILTFRRKPRRSLSKANITWVTNEEADGVCEVQGPSSFYRSVVCDKAWSEDYLPEGNFILNVTVYDRSLNMAGPFQHKWYNRDVKPPELKLTSTPYCDKSYDNASLTWTFNEDATSTCLIKTSLGTEFAVCDKSWSGTFLPEGNVTIEINARDKSRNSAPSFSYTWYNKDITPPVLTFTRNGALTINDATITWSVNEPASANCTLTTPFTTSVFSCDSGSWSGSSLQGGVYELSIRLLDLGNNSAGPYVHKWRNVDTIRPKMTFTKTPSRTYSNATIQWGVSEPVNGSCEIRGPSNFYRNVSCDRSWVGLNLPPGSFTLSIMVIDTSGNIGGPSSHTWINEDVTPPSLQWVGSTPSQTNGSIMLSWTTDEAVTSLCTVHSPVKATDVSCNNKWVGTELRHGEYSLTVKMVDGSGNKAEAVHRWNNTALELVFEVILTLSNVKVTNFTNKTSPEYTKLETESQTGLENFYQQKVDNFKAVHIRDINVFSKPTRQKRSTTSTGSQVIVDHDVVLGGNNMSTGAAALSKTLSTLSTGGSTINIGGSTASFANVTLLLDKRASNVTFSKDSSTCEISQLYVKCGLREYCDEATGMCVTNAKPDNNGMILSIGLGVSGLVVLLLTTIIVVLFYLRKKAEQHKKRQQIENDEKKRFEKPVETITFPPQVMYKPYKYWQ